MNAVRKALAIASLDLRATLRDRQGAFFILALPLAVIVIVGLAVQIGGDRLHVGVLNEGTGPLPAALVRAIQSSPTMNVRPYHERGALDVAIRRGDIDVGAVIPASYGTDLEAGRIAGVDFVALAADRELAAQRTALDAIVTREETTVLAAELAGPGTGASPAAALATARRVAAGTAGEQATLLAVPGGSSVRDGVDYTAPANLVLFMFITSTAAAGAVAMARTLGITRRMLATPTSPAVVLAGITLGRFAIALVQAAVIAGAGLVLFGVHWGNLAGVTAVILLFALLSTGAALLVGTTAKSLEQSLAVAIPLGIGLGMLGGCMWPLAIVGPAMRVVGHLTPHAWAVDALVALGAHRSLSSIEGDLVVLGGFAAVLLLASTQRLRRQLTA